jgi:hypothetical protein
MNGLVEDANRIILQGMKARMFHDLEARGTRIATSVNPATRDTLFHLVYGADAVLPPEIFLESARVAQFNEADKDEERDHDSNLLEEKAQKDTNQRAEVREISEAQL